MGHNETWAVQSVLIEVGDVMGGGEGDMEAGGGSWGDDRVEAARGGRSGVVAEHSPLATFDLIIDLSAVCCSHRLRPPARASPTSSGVTVGTHGRHRLRT